MTELFQTLMLLELLLLPQFEVHDHAILVASFAVESPGIFQGLLLRGLWRYLDQGVLRGSVLRTLFPMNQVLRGKNFLTVQVSAAYNKELFKHALYTLFFVFLVVPLFF